jgi:hypothetical protein
MSNVAGIFYNISNNTFMIISSARSSVGLFGLYSSLIFKSNSFIYVSSTFSGGGISANQTSTVVVDFNSCNFLHCSC